MRKFLNGKFFKKIGGPILRGVVKQIPFVGNPISEIVTNITTPAGEPRKHTSLSVIIQLIVCGAILYDVLVNKATTIKEMIEYFTGMGLLG